METVVFTAFWRCECCGDRKHRDGALDARNHRLQSLIHDLPKQARIQRGGAPGARPLLFSEDRRFLKIVSRSYIILHITVYGLRKISVSGSLTASSQNPQFVNLAADFKSKALLFMCKTCIRTVKDSAHAPKVAI